ncbi:MAG: acetyl-CoA carboxylase biotin carboxylase subunit [Hyphomicrobiales bacterium]|nr:MAG: acetyl-CoA carboxylase biotin carboxylase subunit [Hyphomicrobiales bacterium]
MTRIRTILVANRGEIACRIMRTAKAMGYRTAAVYSDADTDALHVRTADVATRIGPAEARASYLDASAILKAARRLDAQAVHPGYGFLSENAEFAHACHDAGLIFIGPPASAIAAMGNKAAAKRRMIEAGVPCVPGFEADGADDARLLKEAQRIGFPIMVKAAAGGGGRGMRLVYDAHALPAALATARSEALNAFGSDELILEKALISARHVEVQVLADQHGHCIHLGERDCSVQRRHQKVIEEAPSPAVDADLRARMGAAAVAAAKAVGYSNAGTVEFLLDGDRKFYFLEMNTRLQVEHPVTEMVTRLDLVEWQIRIAEGERLPLAQADVPLNGHAIEVRLYAEDPAHGFLPQSGEIVAWQPPDGLGVRVDHGLVPQQAVTPYYDPMLAKIIAHGETREVARRRLVAALERTHVQGLATNRSFLIDCLEHAAFAAGAAATSFIEEHFASIARERIDEETLALAAVLMFEESARGLGHDPAQAWSSSGPIAWPIRLIDARRDETACNVTVTVDAPHRYTVRHGQVHRAIERLGDDRGNGFLRWRWQGRENGAQVVFAHGALHLQRAGQDFVFRDATYAPPTASAQATGGELRAPMNGRIVAVLAEVGDRVEKGQRIVVLEAMKMQHEIVASIAGTLEAVAVRTGDQVATRQVLAEINKLS